MNRREFLKKSLEGIIASIPLISSCGRNPIGVDDKNVGVNIYFLKDDNLTFKDVMEQPLSNLELYWKPWISCDDIKYYDWSAHLIYLKKDMPLSYEGISTYGKPFVVTANGKKCYLGALMVPYSSYGIYNHPVIIVNDYYSDDDIIHISLGYPDQNGKKSQDKRDNLRIKESLITNGQFYVNS